MKNNLFIVKTFVEKTIFSLLVIFLLAVNLTAGDVPVDIIENNPHQFNHFFDINATFDIRAGILGASMTGSPDSLSYYTPNIALGLSYRFKPKSFIGFMLDADISPFDSYGVFAYESQAFKVWDFLVTGGLLIRLHEKNETETRRIFIRNEYTHYGIIRRYIDIKNVKVRRTTYLRVGGIVEFLNRKQNTEAFSSDDPYLISSTFQQKHLLFIGLSWWTLDSLIFNIADDDLAEKYGRRKEVYEHSSFYIDFIVEVKTWAIGGRIGWHSAEYSTYSTSYEFGYTSNKGIYLKATYGANFTTSSNPKRKEKRKKLKKKKPQQSYEM